MMEMFGVICVYVVDLGGVFGMNEVWDRFCVFKVVLKFDI